MAQPRCFSLTGHHLVQLSNPIRETLARTPYTPPESSPISIKSIVESLLPPPNPSALTEPAAGQEIIDFTLCCAALAAAEENDSPTLYWVPKDLSTAAKSALRELSEVTSYGSERDLIADLIPELLPVLKGVIKESFVDRDEEEVVAASAKAPGGHAVLAAQQFRWLVTQVCYPHLGKLSSMVIPCALTALDHWSPEVKDQGLLGLLHLARNVTATELEWFDDAILDACHQNIASNDELWCRVVETSVLMLTCTQRRNPRSSWFDRLLNEMLSHLERQPSNKERRIAWLELIDPVFVAMGLVILAHFRRIFYLFFQWMHSDDDKTILLVLDRLHSVIKLTWIRKSPYIGRLVDELALLYKESATKRSREVIRSRILQLMILLQRCQGLQFEAAWDKHKDDDDLIMLISSFGDQIEALHLEGKG